MIELLLGAFILLVGVLFGYAIAVASRGKP
jgi:hypothetical protein